MSLSNGLKKPFSDEQISWRVGSTTRDKSKGMALAYIDARDVMDRFDEVCGPEGWQCRYVDAGTATTCCEIGVLIDGNWIWKSNGAGKTDVEGEKGAYSDALKRAAVCWGVGRYLYGLGAPWVPLKPQGKSYIIDPSARNQLNNVHAKYAKGVRIQEDAPSDTPPANDAPGRLTKDNAREVYKALTEGLRAQKSEQGLSDWGAKNASVINTLPEDWERGLREEYRAELIAFKENPEPKQEAAHG